MNSFGKSLSKALFCIAVCCANASAETVLNPSFEFEHDALMPNGASTSGTSWGMPDDWPWRNSGSTNAHGIRSSDKVGWSSDGDWSLYVFASTAGSHSAGDYIEFYQSIDMSGITELLFDVKLLGGAHTNSYVAVDSQKLWIHNWAGTHYDVSLDVSSYSGTHEIEVGIEVFEPFGSSADGWTYFDNLRMIPEPRTIALLSLSGLGWLLKRRQAR